VPELAREVNRLTCWRGPAKIPGLLSGLLLASGEVCLLLRSSIGLSASANVVGGEQRRQPSARLTVLCGFAMSRRIRDSN
jgi:hypothetical protein